MEVRAALLDDIIAIYTSQTRGETLIHTNGIIDLEDELPSSQKQRIKEERAAKVAADKVAKQGTVRRSRHKEPTSSGHQDIHVLTAEDDRERERNRLARLSQQSNSSNVAGLEASLGKYFDTMQARTTAADLKAHYLLYDIFVIVNE